MLEVRGQEWKTDGCCSRSTSASSIQGVAQCCSQWPASCISRPPIDAPFKFILFQFTNMQNNQSSYKRPYLNILIKAEIRDKLWSSCLHTPLTPGKITACCLFGFSLANTEWLKHILQTPEVQERPIFMPIGYCKQLLRTDRSQWWKR